MAREKVAKPLADALLCLRVSADEKAHLDAKAKRLGLTTSAFVRDRVGLPPRSPGGAMPGAGRPRVERG